MTIEILQTCDGCNTSRYLDTTDVLKGSDIRPQVVAEGWAPVLKNMHLCVDCIVVVTKK